MVLGYLISPVVQIVDSHGKPIVGAKIYVYKAGTTNTVNTYRDFSNHYNPTPVLTNTLGNCTIIAPDDMIYDIVVKDNRNNLLMSKDNLTVSSGINPDINLRFREGYGIIIRKNGNTVTIAIDTDVVATKDDLATKQDKLTAGDNIDITNNNIINVVNRKTLYTQWPLKVDRGSSMVKLYLDQEFIDNSDNEILPGADLNSYTDASGRQVIGVDTTSTATGDYNFYAGYNNTINGNYNAAFGYVGSINGDGNFIAGQSNNSISGYGNAVFGTRNTITNNGTYNIIQGSENNVNHGSNNLVVGTMNETNGHGCIIGGGSNSLYCDDGYFVNNLQLGDSNTVSADYVNANLLYGDDNTISGNTYRYNIIGGAENTFDCSYGLYNTLVLGYRQTFSGNNVFERNIIAGDGNTFGNGLSNSLVIGTDNNAYSNNVAIIGDGHNVSAEYNARLGKYSTNDDYWFAIGNGTDDANRSNVFEVRKNNDIYFEYNNQMHQLVPAGAIRQFNVSIPNDGTTVTLYECDTDTDSFVIEGKYNTTNSNYEIIVRNTNSVARSFSVFDSINTFYRVNQNNFATIATPGIFDDTRTRIEVFGMGVGDKIPRGEYSIYTNGYTNRLDVTVYEICAYSV